MQNKILDAIKKHQEKPQRQFLNPSFALEMEILREVKGDKERVKQLLNKLVEDGILHKGRCINDNYYYICRLNLNN